MAAKKEITCNMQAHDNDEDESSGKNPYNEEYRIYLYGDCETREKRF